ncbi:MAG: general secretion pathway protein GspL, partial [Comamonadaceae bacterium]
MTMLAILLSDSDTTGHAYAVSADGIAVDSHGAAPAALLPVAPRQEVVAVVPAGRLSWQRTTLPRGGHKADTPRLRAVLGGLLEERLLDDVESLHFAIEPHARAGAPVWVAVCEKAWLQGELRLLESAGHRIARVVPERSPLPLEAGGELPLPLVHVSGTPEQPLVTVATSGCSGV